MAVPVEELARFVASPPPRVIPASVRASRLPRGPLVIAWVIAALVVAGAWPMVAAVFPDHLVDDLRLDLATTGLAEGAVVSVTETGQAVRHRDGDVDIELAVRRIRFRFTTPSGAAVESECHATVDVPEPGAAVGVEYVTGDPAIARIPGTLRSSTPRVGALVLLLPGIAVLWLLKVRAQRRRVLDLLVDGRYAECAVVRFAEHAATLGPGRIAATLESPDGDRLDVDFDANRREAAVLRDRAGADRPVGLLRDPGRPRRFLIVDAMAAAEITPVEDDEDDDEP